MDFDELIISTIGRWGRDCIECADTLSRYYTPKENYPQSVTLCTGQIDKLNKYNNHEEMLYGLKNLVINICFRDLDYLSEIITAVNIENPRFIIDLIWNECASIFEHWCDWFDKYKERLYDLL